MSVVAAGLFKAKCLELMDEVERRGEEVVITKYGRPVAKLVPIESPKPKRFVGSLSGTVQFEAPDAFEPGDSSGDWKVLSDDE